MTLAQLISAASVIGVVLAVAAIGLCAHLCWLAVTDPGELVATVVMFWEVVTG